MLPDNRINRKYGVERVTDPKRNLSSGSMGESENWTRIETYEHRIEQGNDRTIENRCSWLDVRLFYSSGRRKRTDPRFRASYHSYFRPRSFCSLHSCSCSRRRIVAEVLIGHYHLAYRASWFSFSYVSMRFMRVLHYMLGMVISTYPAQAFGGFSSETLA